MENEMPEFRVLAFPVLMSKEPMSLEFGWSP